MPSPSRARRRSPTLRGAWRARPTSSSRSRPTQRVTPRSTATARTSPRSRAWNGSAISPPRVSTAIPAAPGWTRARRRPPPVARSKRRVEAENAWLAFGARHGLAVHVFRLAGIYGPGRNALATARRGAARRIDKPGHVFSRIHVSDIAQVLAASIARPRPGAIYNVCDDEPAPAADVVAHACALLGIAPPPLICPGRSRPLARWRGASMPTTGGSQTPASRTSWGSRCASPTTAGAASADACSHGPDRAAG